MQGDTGMKALTGALAGLQGPAQDGNTLSASEQSKGSGMEGEYNYLQKEMHEPLEAGALICPR